MGICCLRRLMREVANKVWIGRMDGRKEGRKEGRKGALRLEVRGLCMGRLDWEDLASESLFDFHLFFVFSGRTKWDGMREHGRDNSESKLLSKKSNCEMKASKQGRKEGKTQKLLFLAWRFRGPKGSFLRGFITKTIGKPKNWGWEGMGRDGNFCISGIG